MNHLTNQPISRIQNQASKIENEPVNQQNKNMQNEPNLKNNQINTTSFITEYYENKLTFARRQNEPNTDPILSNGLSIDQFEQKMQNEPNFKNTRINVNYVKSRYYENKRPSRRWQNEPNRTQFNTEDSGHISTFCCRGEVLPGKSQVSKTKSHQKMNKKRKKEVKKLTNYNKNMQNEPNFLETKMDVTSVITKDYMKNGVFTPTKNEPKTNPICGKTNPIRTQFEGKQTQFKPNLRQNKPNLVHHSLGEGGSNPATLAILQIFASASCTRKIIVLNVYHIRGQLYLREVEMVYNIY